MNSPRNDVLDAFDVLHRLGQLCSAEYFGTAQESQRVASNATATQVVNE